MRRSVLLGAATALVAAAGVIALTAFPQPVHAGAEPHITRLFVPAIKADCRQRAGVPADVVIGYVFDRDGAVVTIDHDGSLTGLDPVILADLNDCMAQYPIAATQPPPQDHYTRNLLYDYLSSTLRPCLADRVSELPPMPSRADFVVRLYAWDPYRWITRDHPLAQLLEYSAACPDIPPWLEAA